MNRFSRHKSESFPGFELLETRLAMNAASSIAMPATQIVGVHELPDQPQMLVQWNARNKTREIGWRVARSFDGKNFSHYVNVPGHANSFLDTDPALPLGGQVYYRVRAYGNDQDTPYSEKRGGVMSPAAPVLSPAFFRGAVSADPNETITVPLTKATETSTTVLKKGTAYTLITRGSGTNGGADADAEYYAPRYWGAFDTRMEYDGQGTVDYGIRISGVEGVQNWGAYDSAGVYVMHVTGEGKPLLLHYTDDDYHDNRGSISVTIMPGE